MPKVQIKKIPNSTWTKTDFSTERLDLEINNQLKPVLYTNQHRGAETLWTLIDDLVELELYPASQRLTQSNPENLISENL